MSYSIVKKVVFKEDGVYLASASSNVYPRSYDLFRSEWFSDLLEDKGFDAVVRHFAKMMQGGEIKFLRGCKFNNAMLQAKAEIESCKPLRLESFLNGESYGDYVVCRVNEIYGREGKVRSVEELNKLQAMRKDPEAVFAMCKGNVEAFFYSDASVQNNVEFCRRYVKENAGELLFRIPKPVRDDKETALYALCECGCRFRDLSESLRDDADVVLAAFGSKKSPEHLPDLISPRLQDDVELMKKVIEVEPKLHFSRSKIMCNNPEIVLALAKKATWVSDFDYIPKEMISSPEVQRALAARLSDKDLTAEQKTYRLNTLADFVKPEYLVAEQLKDAVALEYKGIVFDDWAVDASGEGQGIWGEMCQDCAEKYKELISEELDDAGAIGACSVKGCAVVGAETDLKKHYYIDFKPELIKPLSKEQLLALEGNGSLDGKIAEAHFKAELVVNEFDKEKLDIGER